MMKINSKKSILFVLSLSVLQTVAMSPIVFAVEGEIAPTPMERQKLRMQNQKENGGDGQGGLPGNMAERQANRQEASCERITTMGANHSQMFSEKKLQFGQKFGDKMAKFDDNRDTHDAKINDVREKQDERRNEMYMKLEEKATTDAQKAAVEAFKKTVEQAVIDRRSAVDKAIDSFRADVNGVVGTKKAAVQSSIDTFQESSSQAFDKAKSDCASGVDPKTVRDTLTTSIKDARSKLQESRQSFEGASNSIPALITTRKATVDQAMQDFKAIMEKARTDLKAALQ